VRGPAASKLHRTHFSGYTGSVSPGPPQQCVLDGRILSPRHSTYGRPSAASRGRYCNSLNAQGEPLPSRAVLGALPSRDRRLLLSRGKEPDRRNDRQHPRHPRQCDCWGLQARNDRLLGFLHHHVQSLNVLRGNSSRQRLGTLVLSSDNSFSGISQKRRRGEGVSGSSEEVPLHEVAPCPK
jgi:hypothetical protein